MLEEDYHEYVKVSHCGLSPTHLYQLKTLCPCLSNIAVPHLSGFILHFLSLNALFQVDGHTLEKRCHMVQHDDGQMMINKVTTVGEVREEYLE